MKGCNIQVWLHKKSIETKKASTLDAYNHAKEAKLWYLLVLLKKIIKKRFGELHFQVNKRNRSEKLVRRR